MAADLHLARRIWKSRPDLEKDSFLALAALSGALLHQGNPKPTALLLAGDIFDASKLDGSTLNAFTMFADELYEADVPVYFVQGNHDYDKMPHAQVQGNTCINEQLVEIDGQKVYGLDWRPRQQLRAALESVPECDLLLLHAAFEHLLGFEGAYDLSLEDIPPHVKNVFVGDIHVRDTTRLNGKGWCVSPGALHPCNMAQGGPHGYVTWEGGESEFEFVDIPTRDIIRCQVEAETCLEELAQILANSTPAEGYDHLAPIVEIKFPNEFTDAVTRLVLKHDGTFPFFVKGSAAGKSLTIAELKKYQESFQRMNLADSLDVIVDPEAQPRLFGLVEALLQSNNPQDVIDQEMERLCAQAS